MEKLVNDVRAFHVACDVPVLDKPCIPPDDRVLLREALIREETSELFRAMEMDDMPEIADGIADAIYVLVGTALEYGIPLARVWDAVQAANMRKVDPVTGKVKYREDGKILKADGWVGPDIWGILNEASQ